MFTKVSKNFKKIIFSTHLDCLHNNYAHSTRQLFQEIFMHS